MINEEKTNEFLIRYVRLREALKPIPVLAGDSPEPIKADWVGLSHAVLKLPKRSDEIESYILNFYREDGELLEALQFDALDIALDQAKAIAGIDPSEWRACNIAVPDDGRIAWSAIKG